MISSEERVRSTRLPLAQFDVLFVLGLSVVAAVSHLLPVADTIPGWPLVVVVYVFFLPGYAVVAALFPRQRPDAIEGVDLDPLGVDADVPAVEYRGMDTLERVGLSFGASLPVSALVGIGLSLSPVGLTQASLVVSLGSVTVASMVFATYRRGRLPAAERYVFPVGVIYERSVGRFVAILRGGRWFDRIVYTVVVVSLVAAAASVGYGVSAVEPAETPTELYLLSAQESAAVQGYPSTFVVGESRTVVVGVVSHERTATQFTLVVQLDRFRAADDGSIFVDKREELSRQRLTLAPGETVETPQTVTPTMLGRSLRLTYLLYAGAPPENPTVENAYRAVHIWVDVLPADEVPGATGASAAEASGAAGTDAAVDVPAAATLSIADPASSATNLATTRSPGVAVAP